MKGLDEYEPVTLSAMEEKRKKAIMPSKTILEGIVETMQSSGDEINFETILEEVDEYYDNKDMNLPPDWEKVTETNIKKWKLV